MGPPPAISGWISVRYSLVPPGVFVRAHALGETANVAVPRRLSLPDLVTTVAATPNPSGVDASSPLVAIWTSASVPAGRSEYPGHGFCAELMSLPSIVVTYELKPAP